MIPDWTSISELLIQLEPLFRFFHALTFFSLGLALLLLPSHVSRLDIARRFPMLALFGFCEAIITWDEVLSCAIGANRLLPPLGHTLLVGVGYTSLLAFGLLLPFISERSARINIRLAIFLPAAWLIALITLLSIDIPFTEAIHLGELAARYGLALPGGILAAIGLRREAHRAMDPKVYRIAQGPVRIAGASIGVFGLLSALHPLIEMTFFSPSILYAVCGLGLAWGLTQSLNSVQDEIERWIEGVERSQALVADRERISRELHDGTIQSIYAAGLMLEGVAHVMSEDTEAAQTQLSRAMYTLNQSIQNIRRYIFDLRGSGLESDLEGGLRELMLDFRVNTLLNITFAVKGEPSHTLTAERRGHIFQIAREALSNVARHARARKVEMSLTYSKDSIRLRISDDGIGMTHGTIQGGHGLRNMRERTRLLEGTLDIDSAPKQGVTVILTVPY